MPTNQLYHNWFRQIRKLRPGQRITQIRNFVWLMIGIYKSRSVSLSRIAGKIPGKAQLLSYTRRLSRFLDNSAIDVRAWYEPIARSWLERQAQSLQQVRLIVDGTKVGFGHQLLMVSLAYRKRSIPIAWSWVPHFRGTAPPTPNWPCCGTFAIFCLEELLFCWWETPNLARFPYFNTWISGIGTMFCGKKPLHTFVWHIKPIGMTSAAGLKKQVPVSGWAKVG